MKKILLIILLFVGIVINEDLFAVGAKQDFKVRLRVVEPLSVEIGNILAEDEIAEINGHQFKIKSLKGTNVEVSLIEKGTMLKNKSGKEVAVEGLVKIEGIKKAKVLGIDEGVRGAIDLKIKEKTVDSGLFEGEYAGAMVVNVNYN